MRRGVIAIVDDDADLRDTVGEIPRDDGHVVLAYAGAREALDALRAVAVRPALILLDLMMPGMSGWEFRDEQLQDPALHAIPVVVFTASRELERHPISANEVLTKPADIQTLLAAIERNQA
jgi:CheY-like chemotaxis protein